MGFEHGESYIITSAFDGASIISDDSSHIFKILNNHFSQAIQVFDVARGRTDDGAEVITYGWNGESNQIWIANSESEGFRLAASHVTDEIRVLDQGDGSDSIVLWKFHGGHNQLWNAFGVAHNPGVFFIQNVATGMCIRNQGLGEPLRCVPLNEDDTSIQWSLAPFSG